jgi:hypothetical protein
VQEDNVVVNIVIVEVVERDFHLFTLLSINPAQP